MKENFTSFWGELQQSLEQYWIGFVQMIPRLALAIIFLVVVFFIAARISGFMHNKISHRVHDPLFGQFLAKISRFFLVVGGFVLSLHIVGLSSVAAWVLAGAGLSAFVIGFAFKDIVENFLAGIILAFNRPFALNDTVKILDHVGHVKALNFRTTHLKTFDEKDVFIPNAKIVKEVVTNLTRDGIIRLEFVVGIAYENNIEEAIRIIKETVSACDEIVKEKEPFIVPEELGVNAVNLRVFFWSTTLDYKKGVLVSKGKVIEAVKNAMEKNGFSLPANVVEVKNYRV